MIFILLYPEKDITENCKQRTDRILMLEERDKRYITYNTTVCKVAFMSKRQQTVIVDNWVIKKYEMSIL